tara:strand:- start:41 stop:493 length:453 start_codon:yes stop_codon:yes gene_type:complete
MKEMLFRIGKLTPIFLIFLVLWGLIIEVPLRDSESISGILFAVVILSVPIIISLSYFSDSKNKPIVEQSKNLSKKYSVLVIFKELSKLLIIISTSLYIYSLVEISNVFEIKKSMIVALTIAYLIRIFSLFCLIKMIEFLFDLDENKKTIN